VTQSRCALAPNSVYLRFAKVAEPGSITASFGVADRCAEFETMRPATRVVSLTNRESNMDTLCRPRSVDWPVHKNLVHPKTGTFGLDASMEAASSTVSTPNRSPIGGDGSAAGDHDPAPAAALAEGADPVESLRHRMRSHHRSNRAYGVYRELLPAASEA